jgi:cytosine/adenosine deaminase-related metal-dependent hydrolase
MARSKRIVVRAEWVLGVEDQRLVLLRNRSVVIEGAHILEVTHADPGPGDVVLESEHGLVLPGFINLHTHCLNTPLFRGIIDDPSPIGGTPIYSILMPLGDLAVKQLCRAELRSVVELGMLERLKSGSTTLVDMWRSEQHVFFEVASAMGIRAYAFPYLFSHRKLGVDRHGKPTYEASTESDGGLGRAVALFHEFDEGSLGRIRVGLGPHGTDTCDAELLRAVRHTANELGCPISIHLAQSRPEVEQIQRRYGKSPVEYLHEIGLLGPDLVAAHCVYATDGDLELLRYTGTPVAHCPVVFARGGTPALYHRFASRNLVTGIGTDQEADYVSELRTAGIVSKLHFGQPEVASAWDLVGAATLQGATALRRPDLGRIAPGARADLVVVDLGHAHLRPIREPIKNLVWHATGHDVSDVIVDGELLVKDAVYLRGDEAAIGRRAALAVEKIWSIAEKEGILPPAR